MKKTLIVAMLFLGVSGTVVSNAAAFAHVRIMDEKVKIKPEELPEKVKATLAGADFKGWEVVNAFKETEKGSFEVELKKGTETKTMKFDKEGKIIA